ncbi:ABC transporter permease [Kordiimonas aquimaris]|uniref:ABC transporter permease n=1 Tax=Kordiimonas aquimaris TaxID=707591 RepID=UPI0021CEF47B|nr:ABC transporter permease [Kordiimonas aquimaris]
MLRSYFIIAVRHLLRNRLYSLINIMGLAIGVAACLLIFLFVRYETSYDKWMPNAENIYRVNYKQNMKAGEDLVCSCAPGKAKFAFEQYFPKEVEEATRFYSWRRILTLGERSFRQSVYSADVNFFNVFEVDFVEGDRETALSKLTNIVISERIAIKYFGSQSPLGEVLTYTNSGLERSYKIAGVFKDFPENSQFNFEIIAPLDMSLEDDAIGVGQNWSIFWGWLYLKLKDGADLNAVSHNLSALVENHAPAIDERQSSETFELSLTNVRDVHLYTEHLVASRVSPPKPIGSIEQVYAFSALAIMILLIACINFMNLSTARALRRAKEVGLRKIVGASHTQLIRQFLGESIMVTAIGVLIAFVLVDVTLPSLNELMGLSLAINYTSDPVLVVVSIGLLGFIGVFAGLYPAFYLSAFRPIATLGGENSSNGAATDKLRAGLTVFQFTVSITLIIATAVVYAQNIYGLNKDLGFSKENKLIVRRLGDVFSADQKKVFAAEVERLSSVDKVSLSLQIPTDIIEYVLPFNANGIGSVEEVRLMPQTIDANFFNLYDIMIIAGRDFDADREQDRFREDIPDGLPQPLTSIIINESAVRLFGFASPEAAIGQVISDEYGLMDVIGVVSDYHFQSLKEPFTPHIYWNDNNFWSLTIGYDENTDTVALQRDVEHIWRNLVPYVPIDSEFLTDKIARQYTGEIKQSKMLVVFSILAIVIACLGLYGLAAFTAERRTKEIAIRKVHGADVWDVVKMLLLQFSKPVLISNLIAWPIAWYFMTDYLNGFTFRIDLNPVYFISTGVIALLIAWVTTTHHALKVARTSPAVVLKGE